MSRHESRLVMGIQRPSPSRLPLMRVLALLLALSLAAGGCTLFGWAATAWKDPKAKPYKAPEYLGLDHKSVAVLVAADDQTLYEHPGAPKAVSRALTRQLQRDIAGITTMDPEQIAQFQLDNPYWNTLPRSELLERLKVQRMVWVDLGVFTTHEPGNKHLWKGYLSASVGVAEAEASNPDNLTYLARVEATYPRNSPVGLLTSDDQTIQLGLLGDFAESVSALFHDTRKDKK